MASPVGPDDWLRPSPPWFPHAKGRSRKFSTLQHHVPLTDETDSFLNDLLAVSNSVHQGMGIYRPWMEARLSNLIRSWLPKKRDPVERMPCPTVNGPPPGFIQHSAVERLNILLCLEELLAWTSEFRCAPSSL